MNNQQSQHHCVRGPGLALILLLAVVLTAPASAQRGAELGGFAGYQMIGGSGGFDIVDEWNFGGYLSMPVRPGIRGELSYSRQNSSLKSDVPVVGTTNLFDLSVEYFHVGGLAEKPTGGPATPFAMFSFGATRFAPKDSNIDDEWRFSIAFGVGAKIQPSERIGLRLQGRALMPMLFSGGGLFCGTGGCDVGLGAGIQFFQIDASAGLYFNF